MAAGANAYNVQLIVLHLLLGLVFVSSQFRSHRWEAVPGFRLMGHVIETKTASSLLACVHGCSLTTSCWTINHRASDGKCELNSADDRWSNGSKATSQIQFNYYKKIIPRQATDVDPALRTTECDPAHHRLNGSCLEINTTPRVAFSAARTACDHKFGRLAVLNTPALETILTKLLPYEGVRYWIDIVRNAMGTLVWKATGEAVSLNPNVWLTFEPDNNPLTGAPEDCASIDYEVISNNVSFAFKDVRCDLLNGYICQYDPWVYRVW